MNGSPLSTSNLDQAGVLHTLELALQLRTAEVRPLAQRLAPRRHSLGEGTIDGAAYSAVFASPVDFMERLDAAKTS